MGEQLDRFQIGKQLRKIVSSKGTGRFIIRTSDNHLVILGIDQGAIVSVSYSLYRGSSALPKLAEIEGGSCHFDACDAGPHQNGLPSTDQIIFQMEMESLTAPLSPQVSAAKNKSQAAPTITLSERGLVNGLSNILINYIGPIAPMICEDAVSSLNGVSDKATATTLIHNLAAEIMAKDEQQKFIKEGLGLLNKLSR